jgi:FlaG/FlaF family flagellin (archaellin)
MLEKQRLSGVSPVIGIILMVAVTVGLVALASTIVFDLGSNVNEPADVSGQVSFDEEAVEITAEVVRNENAQSVSLRWTNQDGDTKDATVASGGAGNTGVETLNASEICVEADHTKSNPNTLDTSKTGDGGIAELVANVGNTDNQQVVETVEYEGQCTT